MQEKKDTILGGFINHRTTLGEDEDSSAEEAVNEEIAQRIQEQYDLETALEESAQAAGVEPEPADLGVGGAAADWRGKG